jgi:hypothetical protein
MHSWIIHEFRKSVLIGRRVASTRPTITSLSLILSADLKG